jgi:hypothetical protein
MAQTDSQDEGLLTAAAKKIGSAAGKVAAAVGAGSDATSEPRASQPGKLPKKNKERLPRKLKKARQKQAMASGDAQ